MAEETLYHRSDAVSKTFPVKPKLRPKPKAPSKSPESKYWASFKSHQIRNLESPIPSIGFSPDPTSRIFAASHSTSLALYSVATLEPVSTITRFSDVVTSFSFRSDGALLAASDLSGLVQVFSVKSISASSSSDGFSLKKRAPLRRLRSHTRPVRLVRYPHFDRAHLVSGGDDAIVKYWDVVGESVVDDLVGHRDYVRCGDWSPVNDGIFASGSYDHTVKLWDVRAEGKKSVLDINHGKPVEDLVFLPSGGMVATAGGNCVKIWDVIGGGRLVYSMETHNKTVTGLSVGRLGKEGEEEYRLLSVALDGYMKVFDFGRMKVMHSMSFPAPLMSVAVSPDSRTRVIGTSNGTIFVGKRKVKAGTEAEVGFGSLDPFKLGRVEEPRRRGLKPSYFRYFNKGQGEKPEEGDQEIVKQKRVKLAMHDKLLKKFRHKEALVLVLGGQNPENTVAVMEELVSRRKLLKCVSNLDEEELGLLMGFLQKYSTIPRHARFLMGLTKKVLEVRAEDIRASDALRGHIRNLRRSVDEEIRIQNSLQEIQGVISPLLRIAGRR